jgi:hypothetical protein
MIGTICETLAVTMPTYKEHDMRAEADAKLMAAAPDMRAALIEACKFIQKHNEEFAPTEDLDLTDEEREELGEWMESCEAVLKQCQSALAKTEGRDF